MLRIRLIENKLKVFTASSISIMLVILFITFVVYDYFVVSNNLKSRVLTISDIIIEKIEPSLEFRLNKNIYNDLQSFLNEKSFINSCVFDNVRKIVAKYPKELECEQNSSKILNINLQILNKEKKIIGKLLVNFSKNEINDHIQQMTINLSLMFFILAIFIYIFSNLLQRIIINPLSKLTETTKFITKNKDYSIRTEVNSDDEVGALSKSFNAMISEIRKRDHKLNNLNKSLEKKVIARTKDLEEELDRRTDFVGYLTHEVVTPSTVICDGISLMKDLWDVIPSEKKKEQIDDIYNNTERLRTLIKELTDISMLKSNQTKFNMNKADSYKLCEDVVKECSHMISVNKKPITIKMEPSKVATELVCDSSKMQQVFRNIINNAIRYSESGEILVSFSEYQRGRKKMLKISFKDEGVGIPPKELKTIFNLFYQSSRTKSKAGGKGSGLQLCQRVVEAHKGKIWAENNKKKGSIFHITLPMNLDEGVVTI